MGITGSPTPSEVPRPIDGLAIRWDAASPADLRRFKYLYSQSEMHKHFYLERVGEASLIPERRGLAGLFQNIQSEHRKSFMLT